MRTIAYSSRTGKVAEAVKEKRKERERKSQDVLRVLMADGASLEVSPESDLHRLTIKQLTAWLVHREL